MKDSNRPFSKAEKQMANKFMKNMFNEANQKGNPNGYFIPIKMAIIEKKSNVANYLKKVLYCC